MYTYYLYLISISMCVFIKPGVSYQLVSRIQEGARGSAEQGAVADFRHRGDEAPAAACGRPKLGKPWEAMEKT